MGQRYKLRIAFSLKMNGEQSMFSRAMDGCTTIHHPKQFYKEQIVNIFEARNDKDEDDFEKIKQLQEQRYKEFNLYAWIFFFGFVSIHFLIKGNGKETYTLEGKMTSDKAAEERMAFKGPQTTPTPKRRWTAATTIFFG